MAEARSGTLRILGFGIATLAFAVTQPLVLAGLPLVLLLVTYGPQSGRAAIAAAAIVAVALMGSRSGLWWFERGWPLMLGGVFVWIVGWRPRWSFFAQALTALAFASVIAALVLTARPAAWVDLDASMASRAARATATAMSLLGENADDAVRAVMQEVAVLQVAVFPALLGLSSLGALGIAVSVHGWLAGGIGERFEPLREFRFNDHLVWIWLIGLAMIVAPVGEVGARIGGNAVFFMGLLYILRGAAVLLSLIGGISVMMGVVGGVIALLIYPLLVLLLAVSLLVGLGDTWLNVRDRLKTGSGGG